jgi:ketosteroid isomerase-like protein
MRVRLASKLSLVLLVCLAIRLAAQESDVAAQVRRQEEKWAQAYKDRDLDVLTKLLTEDFIITVEDGNTYSKEGYLMHTADSTVKVEFAELSDLRVRVRGGGNIAVVTGVFYQKGRSNGKPYEYHDRLTDVWVKTGNGWRVLASHYSVPRK